MTDALNAWLDNPNDWDQAVEAMEKGGRLDLPSKAGALKSLLGSCAEAVHGDERWKSIEQAARRFKTQLNILDGEGMNPLHRAAESGNASAAASLIKLGANPSSLSTEGLAALHFACRALGASEDFEWKKTLNILLAHAPGQANRMIEPQKNRFVGKDFDEPEFGDSNSLIVGYPIHLAIRSSLWIAAQILSEHGADLNAREPLARERPIDLAAKSASQKMLLALIHQGADQDLDPEPGLQKISPLHAALGRGWTEASVELASRPGSLCAPSSHEQGGAPLDKIPPEPIAKGDCLSFWRGYLSMNAEQAEFTRLFKAKPASAIKLSQRKPSI